MRPHLPCCTCPSGVLYVASRLPCRRSCRKNNMSVSTGRPAEDEARVIILGGGLAGLRCAAQLVRRHGFSEDHVVLLEASTRIGGRIKTNTSFINGFSVSSPVQPVSHLLHSKLCLFRQRPAPIRPIRPMACADDSGHQ